MMTGEAGTPVYMRYLLARGQNVSTTSNLVAGVEIVVVVVDIIFGAQRTEWSAMECCGGGREYHTESSQNRHIYFNKPSIIYEQVVYYAVAFPEVTAHEHFARV